MDYSVGRNVRKLVEAVHASTPPRANLALEMLELLTSYYYFTRPKPESDDLADNLRRIHYVRLLHDDIILRLCTFADEDTRSWSFEQVRKAEVQHGAVSENDQKLRSLTKCFRETLRPIMAHRIQRVAHRAKRDRLNLRPCDFRQAIGEALEIVDLFFGEKVSYAIVGIDIRQAFEKRTRAKSKQA